MRGHLRSSVSTTCRPVRRYAALGLGATLTAILGFIAIGKGGSPSVIAVGSGPQAIAITPEGTAAYVANFNSDNVTVLRLKH
jgi:DNA-binding beta-propeller fold protein YncE